MKGQLCTREQKVLKKSPLHDHLGVEALEKNPDSSIIWSRD